MFNMGVDLHIVERCDVDLDNRVGGVLTAAVTNDVAMLAALAFRAALISMWPKHTER